MQDMIEALFEVTFALTLCNKKVQKNKKTF